MKRQRHNPLVTLTVTQISLSRNKIILAKVQRRWLIAKFFADCLEIQWFDCIFAATVLATPLNDAYHGGTSFLYMYMKYDKQPIALSQQLKLLEQRGLMIQNEETALSQLQSISYFRLASYWHSMEVPNSDKHQFLPDSDFDDVIELYQFDKKLRTLVFTSIQDIEIALRTRIIQCFSLKYGAFWFMGARLFKNENIFATCLENIQKEVNRSNEDFLKEHFKKYDEPSLPPVWKTMEVVSFGTLSKLYCNFNDTGVKKQVARSFGLPQYLYLESWMKCASVLRNYCAHHARLWNRRFPIMPQLPKRLPLKWIDTSHIRPIKLYAQLCCLAYLEQSINPNSQFKSGIKALLANTPQTTLKAMGFPANWREEALWKD